MKGKNKCVHWQHTDNEVTGHVIDLLTPLALHDLLGRRKSSFLVIAPDIVICESSTHWSTRRLREALIYLSLAPMSRILCSRKEQNPQINTLRPSQR